MPNFIDKIVSLAKRRGFIYPGSEIYGGLANSWDYGPLGVELKNNIKKLWWDRFVHRRNDVVGIDAALLMNPRVWEASGHLKEFVDPLVECRNCHERMRADTIDTNGSCPQCGEKGKLTAPRQFNMLLKTFLGPAEEKANEVFFRPETAQAMFVDFKTVLETSRQRLPFGIAQIGKAFRNEITPGNFIFRTREFEQMEIEYFVRESEWQESFEAWRREMHAWIASLGIRTEHVHDYEVPESERAHYSKRTIDFEYDFPFGKKELYGLAYRTDFDLKNHFPDAPPYRDPDTGEAFWPHVVEPTWGVDRTVLAVLCDAYEEEKDRIVLRLHPSLAPYTGAVFPLLANKPQLVNLAREIYDDLRKHHHIAWDDRGNIGKRYYAQDEIGTPCCITVDFESLEKGDVTVRDRDTAQQIRIKTERLSEYVREKIVG